MLQEDTTGRIICDIVNMQSSSVLYSMSLTLSIFKVTRRLLQLQNPTTCMVDHPGLEPVCLNVYSLQNASNVYRADYGPLRLRGIEQYVFFFFMHELVISAIQI